MCDWESSPPEIRALNRAQILLKDARPTTAYPLPLIAAHIATAAMYAPPAKSDVVGRSHQAMREYQAGILAEYVPYTPLTSQNLRKLADLQPKTLAIMHGSSFSGDCARALTESDQAFKEVFGRQNA
ncbi:MAG: hypothetical protein ACRD1O_00320 [Terriglobia bacterium]